MTFAHTVGPWDGSIHSLETGSHSQIYGHSLIQT